MASKNNNNKLTTKQIKFVSEYLKDLNATAAAERSGYKDPSQGPHLMQLPHIMSAINKAQAKILKKNEATAESVLRVAAAILFAKMGDIIKWDDKANIVSCTPSDDLEWEDAVAIQEFSSIPSKHYKMVRGKKIFGKNVRVKLFDKMKALEFFGKYFGLFKDKKTLDELLSDLAPALAGPIREALTKYVKE